MGDRQKGTQRAPLHGYLLLGYRRCVFGRGLDSIRYDLKEERAVLHRQALLSGLEKEITADHDVCTNGGNLPLKHLSASCVIVLPTRFHLFTHLQPDSCSRQMFLISVIHTPQQQQTLLTLSRRMSQKGECSYDNPVESTQQLLMLLRPISTLLKDVPISFEQIASYSDRAAPTSLG